MEASPLQKILNEKKRPPESELKLPFTTPDGKGAGLELMTYSTLQEEAAILRLARWRERHAAAFPAQTKVTLDETKHWLETILTAHDRLIFWIRDTTGAAVGKIGLSHLSNDQSMEVNYLLRGESSENAGLMSTALETLVGWQRAYLGIPKSYARVFGDNESVVLFFSFNGYSEIQRAPLFKETQGDRVTWREIVAEPYRPAERYFVTLEKRVP